MIPVEILAQVLGTAACWLALPSIFFYGRVDLFLGYVILGHLFYHEHDAIVHERRRP